MRPARGNDEVAPVVVARFLRVAFAIGALGVLRLRQQYAGANEDTEADSGDDETA